MKHTVGIVRRHDDQSRYLGRSHGRRYVLDRLAITADRFAPAKTQAGHHGIRILEMRRQTLVGEYVSLFHLHNNHNVFINDTIP